MSNKILILTSDTGGGHTSAARAIEAGLGKVTNGFNYFVHIAHALEECHFITRRLAGLYNVFLRSHQAYMKYYHSFVNHFSPDQWNIVYKFAAKYIPQLIERHCPNVIISVHPMIQYTIGRILKELKLTGKIPLVTVVTDPAGNSWRGWYSNQVDLYIVAHERAKDELISFGVDENRIRICGMPIHPKFQNVGNYDPCLIRQELELSPDKFTVFMNAGWIGGGNIPKIYRSLAEADLDIQLIFLSGRNRKLEKEAQRIARNARFPIRVLGYSDNMDKLMSASNIMVSKLGGLTTFEALASKLPIIADCVTPPMPQEAGTATLLEESNAGILLRRVSDIVPIIKRFIDVPEEYLSVRKAAGNLGKPAATQQIVREISNLIEPVKFPELITI